MYLRPWNESSADIEEGRKSKRSRIPLRACLNVLRFRVAMALRSSTISNYPIVAFIEPTSFCNLRCPSCPTGIRSNVRARASLSLERFRELIDELCPYLLVLYFYNCGEPLLHKDSCKMISYASQKGIVVCASSNLSMKLSDEYALELVRSGLYSLVVGLDGIDQQTYGKYRRGGNFDLVVSNVEKIVRLRKQEKSKTPRLILQYLVFRHNEATIDGARKLAERIGIIGIDHFNVAAAYVPPESHGTGIEPPSDEC